MGIRTIGFEKAPRSSTSVDEEKSQKQKKEGANPVPQLERKSGGGVGDPVPVPIPVAKPPDAVVRPKSPEGTTTTTTNSHSILETKLGPSKEPDKTKTSKTLPITVPTPKTPTKSPLKVRTPTSMARLGGMKTSARKLKKHRKRSLYVQSATKILRSSIRSTKTRQATRQQQEEKPQPRESASPPQSRISTRMLVRRNSREGVPEDPLRTVELIKRPLELREPATKLLYLASLGLYPNTGDSDSTPIVVVKEVCTSPGKKNGVRKSLELPLMPNYKRFMDLANQDKRNSPENVKTATASTSKQSNNKKDTRKRSPTPSQIKTESVEEKKALVVAELNQRKSSSPSPRSDIHAISTIISNSQAINAVSSITVTEVIKKKTPVPSTSTASFDAKPNPNLASVTRPSLDLTITPSASINNRITMPPLPQIQNHSHTINSKSLLKANLTNSRPPPPLKVSPKTSIQQQSLPPVTVTYANSNNNLSGKVDKSLPTTNSLLTSSYATSEAMNLLMSNITILPAALPAVGGRKRCASPLMLDQNTMSIRPVGMESVTCGNNVTISIPSMDRKPPPKKKQKSSNEITRAIMPPMTAMSSLPVANNLSQNAPYLLPSLTQHITDEGALNLCMKRRSEPPPIPVLSQSPPKLLYKSEARPPINGSSKPLNLIIPRPPPLTKAPLEITNIANCPQNLIGSLMGVKGGNLHPPTQPKKPRKLRQQNHNHINNINQANHSQGHQSISLPALPMLAVAAETAVHAKSLLKCMNGEENACREVGESLDSVKTMLARLQTSIGPAVNGVRLITIE